MEQVVYFSELQELAPEREKEIFDALLRLGKEKSLRGKKITWEELEQRAPELAGCTHSTRGITCSFAAQAGCCTP